MHSERERELWEHITALQSQIDHLRDQDDARLERIARLERDRETLRRQLGEARKGRFRRRPESPVSDQALASAPSLDVPGVGTIRESEVRPVRERRDLKVATIVDGFTATVLDPEFQGFPISAGSWEAGLEAADPDLLFVESAYRGADGSWTNRVARFASPSPHLERVVGWCRQRSIPTVFWNKEDPINFEWFIESARLFDFVFTVDGDMIPTYRDALGHDRVHLLQFFAQPAIHYPGPEDERTGAVAFAGSYYAAKHPERREQIEMLLDPAREFGLHIFDRHGDTDDERFRWPEKYRPHIMGSLTYLQTVEAYRRYRVFLNVNTVTSSPTMCARRIFELAASGTPIVTAPSRATAQMLPEGSLIQVASREEDSAAIDRLLRDPATGAAMADEALAWVLESHTANHRVDTIVAVL